MDKEKITLKDMKEFHKKVYGFERKFSENSYLYNTLVNIYLQTLKNNQNKLNHTFFCPNCNTELKVWYDTTKQEK